MPGPNKQNPDSGIETTWRPSTRTTPAAVQTNRIPTQGLKQWSDQSEFSPQISPNKQNPDSGIETACRSLFSLAASESKQTESRLRD